MSLQNPLERLACDVMCTGLEFSNLLRVRFIFILHVTFGDLAFESKYDGVVMVRDGALRIDALI